MSMRDARQNLILNQTVYFSILGAKNGEAMLGAPNMEVARTLSRLYMSRLLPQNKKTDKTLRDIYPIDDESSCRALVQMIILERGIDYTVGRHNAWGRSDIQVGTKHAFWLMEFKFVGSDEPDQDEAERKALLDAVTQVRERKYAEDVAGRTLIRMGLVFSKRTRQITRWELVPLDAGDSSENVPRP